jgi:Holliday junction resolvase
MGRLSRSKGARGEREVRDVLRKHGYEDAIRGAQRSGSPDSPDVAGGAALQGVHFESKRSETFSLYDSLAQAIRDAGSKVPIVVHRKNGKPWVAVLELEVFIKEFLKKVFPPHALPGIQASIPTQEKDRG